jgi:hypothetical protein
MWMVLLALLGYSLSQNCDALNLPNCQTYPRNDGGYHIDIRAALRGYNPFLANSFSSSGGGDPGLMDGVIFDHVCGETQFHYARFS